MSTNISKQKRQELLGKIEELRRFVAAAPQDQTTGSLLTYLNELEKDVGGRKYGLLYEEHREEIDEVLATHAPVLTEDPDSFIDRGGQMNFLIEGDNLAALKLLEKTHRGKIDLIYIDPPYNRGKQDFIYDDDYVGAEDGFRHSKWISFMKKRLEIARRLLAKDGLLFISIDDYEMTSTRLLCDEIFGESLFINMFVWQRNSSGKTEKDKFTVNTEYILLYGKTPQYTLNDVFKPLADSSVKLYNKDDHDGRGKYATVSLQKPRDPGPETTYDYVDNTGKVWPCPPKGWRMVYDKIKALENDGRLYFGGKSLRVKDYWNERVSGGKRIDTLWDDIAENNVGSRELEALLEEKGKFDNPKPTELIMRCLRVGSPSACVLDFFAGSGTTGHAVMKLNAEDGGGRSFILCTSNEGDICRGVTYPRIRRAIEKEEYAASLKYYAVDYVPTDGRLYYEYADELLRHIRALVELETGMNLDGSGIAVVESDEELDSLMDRLAEGSPCRTVYMSHDVLMDGAQQEALRSRGIGVHVVPGYYYRESEG